MTPEELARLYPRLYHVTTPGALAGMVRHGLLPAVELLALFGADVSLAKAPRRHEVRLEHPVHGVATVLDNLPLQSVALARCLDDGLGVADWCRMLNERVFFWADEAGLDRLLRARLNRVRARDVLVLDTLGLVRACAARVELSAINSGSAMRRAARRGLGTYVELGALSHAEWRRRYGRGVLEVTVRGGVVPVRPHVLEVRRVEPR